jgi:hypothetical protein
MATATSCIECMVSGQGFLKGREPMNYPSIYLLRSETLRMLWCRAVGASSDTDNGALKT